MHSAADILPELPEKKTFDATISRIQKDLAFIFKLRNPKGDVEPKEDDKSNKLLLPGLRASKSELRRPKRSKSQIHRDFNLTPSKKKDEKRKYLGKIHLPRLLRSEPLPSSKGKRSGFAKDDEIEIFLLLTANNDLMKLQTAPDTLLGPPLTPRPNRFTDLWGLDAEKNGCMAGKSASTVDVWRKERDEKELKNPTSLKGKIAKILAFPLHEIELNFNGCRLTDNSVKINNYGIVQSSVIRMKVNEKLRKKRLKEQQLSPAPLDRGVDKKQISNRSTCTKETKTLPELLPANIESIKSQYDMRNSPYFKRQKTSDKYHIMPEWKEHMISQLFHPEGSVGRKPNNAEFFDFKMTKPYDDSIAVDGIRQCFEQKRGKYEKYVKMSDWSFLRRTLRTWFGQEVKIKDAFAGWKNSFLQAKKEKQQEKYDLRRAKLFGGILR